QRASIDAHRSLDEGVEGARRKHLAAERRGEKAVLDAPPPLHTATCSSVRASDLYHPASRRNGVNRVATFLVGFVLGGAVIGGAMDLAHTPGACIARAVYS